MRYILQLRTHAIHGPCQVDPDNLVPVLILELRHRRDAMGLANNARDVGRAVQPPMFSHYALHPGVDLRTLRYINALNVTCNPLFGEIHRRIFHCI